MPLCRSVKHTWMKIAHIVDCMEVGGAEMLVSQMCRLQREQGHDPSVYAVATLGPLGAQMQREGFAVHPQVGQSLADASRNFFRIFKELRPDVVHLHNPTPTIFAAAPARMAGVRAIISTRHSLVAPPRNPMVELKYGVAAKFCDWIVDICDATVDNLKVAHKSSTGKIIRVYNGALPLTRVSKERCPTTDGFTLVFLGRLEPVKNHSLMLRAFSIALSSMPTLRLWIVGGGRERARLEAVATELAITPKVTFWGQQMEVARFLSAADAFIMSSISEGLPMSLLQAFSLGLPSIVTNVGGMAEVVHLAQAGISVPVTDPAEMGAAILHLAKNDAERKQFGLNAQRVFDSQFTLRSMVDAYMHLYQETKRARSIQSK